jgi:hypothetical protein
MNFSGKRDQTAVLNNCAGSLSKEEMIALFHYATREKYVPLVIHLTAGVDEPRFFCGFTEAIDVSAVLIEEDGQTFLSPGRTTNRTANNSSGKKKCAGAGSGKKQSRISNSSTEPPPPSAEKAGEETPEVESLRVQVQLQAERIVELEEQLQEARDAIEAWEQRWKSSHPGRPKKESVDTKTHAVATVGGDDDDDTRSNDDLDTDK